MQFFASLRRAYVRTTVHKEEPFFFEKKNQKTFVPLTCVGILASG